MTANDEKRLIDKAGSGDVRAFEALYRLHSARVHGLCVRLCDNRADAQDATQETFVKAWRGLRQFRGTSAFSTWLHRIAFNECMNIRRRSTARDTHLQVVEPTRAGDSSSMPELEQLERAVARLPDRAREALILNKIYGYTHEETAEFMGTTSGAAKAQVHRAVNLLRALVPAADVDSPGPASAATRSALSDE
ncbi:MAG TPA: RNA polymerase sigma factor [Gammaproteobacteria bacterium]|nr:RNA polymerase sigma factor [Gammaproteobacteria bacterium]